MKKFTITNSQNEKIIVDLVRYFEFQNNCYLIYTMNEVDEKNYLKLYLVRIMEELGLPIVQLIKNENDWAGMQNIIKKVIKEIKCEKYNNLIDLDYTAIDGIKITDPRFFKLDSKLVDILSYNYMNENTYDPSSTNDANSIFDGENNDNVSNEEILNIPISTIGIENNNSGVDLVNDNQGIEHSGLSNDNFTSFYENIESDNEVNVEKQPNIIIESNLPEENIVKNEVIDKAEINVENTDYKSLYFIAREEIEVSNQLTDELLEQLLKYKEKYGELD